MSFTITAPALSAQDPFCQALQHKIDSKTKPLGALGLLEKVAFQVGWMQQTLTPSLSRPQLFVFAGDHGAAKAGVSAYPQDVTWQMVENFLAGGAAVNVFARQSGFDLAVVDVGVAHDFAPREGLIQAKVAPGTRNFITEAAMSAEGRDRALETGAQLVRQAGEAGPAPGRGGATGAPGGGPGLPGRGLRGNGHRQYGLRLPHYPRPHRYPAAPVRGPGHGPG